MQLKLSQRIAPLGLHGCTPMLNILDALPPQHKTAPEVFGGGFVLRG